MKSPIDAPFELRPFALLADPANYIACTMELSNDASARAHWIEFFIRHLELLLSLGVSAAVARGESEPSARDRAHRCRKDFVERFHRFAAHPTEQGSVTILTLDSWRDETLRKHGFVDCMIDLKDAENRKVLPLLREVCDEVDRHHGVDQLLTIVQGVFAGNLFDMGAKASAEQFAGGQGPGFFATRGGLRPRPWLIDEFDAFAERILNHKHNK
ncbi:MAG TPA: ARMT1-like domain-containing protein, partial [Tepidisphaeraceae bacterium]|nr:ARMT1-like domain-containing protein [Tepidisphaeraceae bacterium]